MNKHDDQQPIVIVIDDDELVCEAVSDLLRSIGLQTKLFASVSEFLKWKLPDAPSCLVLDVRLPGLSGLDFQSELNKRSVQIPIVFMTAHGDIPMSVRAIKGGAVDFLAKPFRDQDMLDAVQSGLAQDRARSEDCERYGATEVRVRFVDTPGTRDHEARNRRHDE
jgi:FixJ family two-component response regulator